MKIKVNIVDFLSKWLFIKCIGIILFVASPAYALETLMEDNFAQGNGSILNTTKWNVNRSNIFKVNAGSSWNFLQGILLANNEDAYAQVEGLLAKDLIIDFDLNRFVSSKSFFDLVLRQNSNGNTRLRFAASASNNEITVSIMQQGSLTSSINIGTTLYNLGQYDWVSFRVRINDDRLQVFTKRSTVREFTYLGQYISGIPNNINSGAGYVQLLLPKQSFDNYLNIDSFKVRQVDSGKKVFADFHGYKYTREHDGQLGNWKQETQSSQTPYHFANYNADLIDENGKNKLAGPGNPAIGMQSNNDPDYAEYHALIAKMAGIDGFLQEYGCSAGLTDSDLQLMQQITQNYGMQFGINWLDGFYYAFIQNTSEYQTWCTSDSKDPNLQATKSEYLPQVIQRLIDWVYDKPNAATIGGKPLMPIFQGSPMTLYELITLKTKTFNFGGLSNVTFPFVMPRRAPIGLASAGNPNVQKFWSDPSGWDSQTDGTFGWKPLTEHAISSSIYSKQGDEQDSKEYARAHVEGLIKCKNPSFNMAGVMPGFDNKFNAAWGQWDVELLDRKNGLTYTEVWEQYLRDRDVIDAVLITTWNDHTEGTGIEPMGDYGDREMRATAKYVAQFKGLPDNSASLDFNLPKQLFELRKLVKFLELVGFPLATLNAESAKLNTAGQEIASASYTVASQILSTVQTQLLAWKTSAVITTNYTHSFFSTTEVEVTNAINQNIDIPSITANVLKNKYFEGFITFEYLDNSTFMANKSLFLFSNPGPASTGKPGEWRICQMQMRHGDGDGQWKTARVRLYKKNLPFTSNGIDLYFSALGGASNGGTIRNVTVTFNSYDIVPYTWNAAATTEDMLTAENWSSDMVPTSTGFTEATRQDARWDGLISGALNQSFGAPFGGDFGVGVVLSSNQKGNLTITNSNNAMQNLRIINSTALGLGGIQIANGAGALTIGATGIANPIQLVLGGGANPLTYYFTNNSNNTATIEENVTIISGSGHNANLTFDAGNWHIKGRITNLNSGGSLNISAGKLTLSGANTYTGATNISGGTLMLQTTNALPVGASAGVIRFKGESPTLDVGQNNLGSATDAANSAGELDFDVNSTINLGASGSNSYYFKASNSQTWDAATVTIYNWKSIGSTNSVFVGSDASGLSAAQLAKITFNGYNSGANLLTNGELVPIDVATTIKGGIYNDAIQFFAHVNANKQLIINAPTGSNYNIYNSLGMFVENGYVNLGVSTQNSEPITCSQKLIRGIYVVQIIDKGKIHTNKVIVN